MARPAKLDIVSGLQAWDQKANDNDEVLFNGPLPIHEHTGDESDLTSTFAAAAYDRCSVMVDHSTLGWCRYVSDGSVWLLVERLTATTIADIPGAATAAELKINALLAALRNGDRIA